MPWPFCEVCNQPAFGVYCSALGPISHAYCSSCMQAGLEPWGTLVGAMFGIGCANVPPEYQPLIQRICDFYKKTEEELWAEVDRVEQAYEAFSAQENKNGD